MNTGGAERLVRLESRPVDRRVAHRQEARTVEATEAEIAHLGPAGSDQAEPVPATKPANSGSAMDLVLDPAVAAAVEHERRRIAADVHDLIMQDLALALAHARMLADAAPEARTVVDAGERALANAREVVTGLSARQSESIAAAVISSAQRAARDVPVTVVAPDASALPQPDGQTFSTIVHVTREAVTNAVKHGRATNIEVTLECPEEWRLRIRDDGCGFSTDESSPRLWPAEHEASGPCARRPPAGQE